MSFTYDVSTPLGQVRFLVADTVDAGHIFEDAEVEFALQMESSQGLYVSGPGSFASVPVPFIPQVYSVYRAAALLYDTLAGDLGRVGEVVQLLDVKLSDKQASTELRSIATGWRAIEARRGSFAIAEWVNDCFSFRERLEKSWQRQGI